MDDTAHKGFFLWRFFKRLFITGFANILPTILVISILVIAYNFLDNNLGEPINHLIKVQLIGPWKNVSIGYLDVDAKLFEPVKQESYEELVKRVQESSIRFLDAKKALVQARALFEEAGTERIQKKASATDPDYIRFLDREIEKLRQDCGLAAAEANFKRERALVRKEISRENELREANQQWGSQRKDHLRDEIDSKYPSYIGLVIALFIILLVGMIFNSMAGRSLKNAWERALTALPLIRKIYPYTKQLTEFLFQEGKSMPEFERVVAVPYPRKGIYAIGFPTGEAIIAHPDDPVIKMVSLFIPSSPTPFTGYTIMIDERELIPLSITVEEAIRFCVTGGVVKPNTFLASNGQALLENANTGGTESHEELDDESNLRAPARGDDPNSGEGYSPDEQGQAEGG